MNIPLTAVFPYPIPPGHKELPDKEDNVVTNFQEDPQSGLLTETLLPVLRQLHPDGNYVIGRDSFIYWRLTDPPTRGAKSPDWYYIPNRPQLLDGEIRRSYVLWMEGIPPLVIVEQVSGDGSEEHDRTPETGKMWVYEQVLRAPCYAIFDGFRETLEVYQLVNGRYERMTPNEQGRYPIPQLGVELGLWRGVYFFNEELVWVRWWDRNGNLLPTLEEQNALQADEMIEVERQKEQAESEAERNRLAKEQAESEAERNRLAKEQAESEAERNRLAKEQAESEAEHAREQAERLADKLRSLGINPDEV